MKHIFLKAVVAALSVTLASCGKAGNNGVAGGVSGNDADLGKTIQIVKSVSEMDEETRKNNENRINTYLSDKTDYKVSLIDIPEEEYEKTAAELLDSNRATLVWIDGVQEDMGINALLREGKLADITELIPETDLYNAIGASVWETSKVEGKNYYIPSTGEIGEGYSLIFRKEAVSELGWNTGSVKKLADLDKFFADAKENEKTAVFLTGNTAIFSSLYIDNYDFFLPKTDWIAIDRKSGDITNPISSNDYKEFCTRMAQWAEEGYLSEDEATGTTETDAIKTKAWAVSLYKSNEDANLSAGQETVAVSLTGYYFNSETEIRGAYGINSQCSEKEIKAVIDVLGLIKTNSELTSVLNGEGTVTDIKGSDSPAKGFRFDTSSVAMQIEACKKVFAEYGYPLENGGYSSSDIDSVLEHYQTAMNEAGYQDIVSEANRQYELWKNPPVAETASEEVTAD